MARALSKSCDARAISVEECEEWRPILDFISVDFGNVDTAENLYNSLCAAMALAASEFRKVPEREADDEPKPTKANGSHASGLGLGVWGFGGLGFRV